MKRNILLALLLIFIGVGITATHNSPLTSLNPGIGKTIIDSHVHVAGLGYGGSGSFVNDQMRNNIRFPFYLWAMGVSEAEIEQQGDRILFDKISSAIAASKTVNQAVILAMDGYVDSEGQLDKSKTQIYVPNDFVAREVKRFDNLIFGASINPNRKDAIARLRKADKEGAVLVKWLPSIMSIDPANPKHIPFYKVMAELGIPLLTHTGMEKSFADARDDLADPLRLKLPLEQGVTVIAAHIATTGKSEGQDNFERILPMFNTYPKLYVDISSLTQLNKLGYLKRAMAVDGLTERMIYGSDWPLQFFPLISPWYHLANIDLRDAWQVSGIRNQWDQDVALKVAYGLPDEVFSRTATLLKEQ